MITTAQPHAARQNGRNLAGPRPSLPLSPLIDRQDGTHAPPSGEGLDKVNLGLGTEHRT
jgi:hypothetical protein